MVAGPFHDYAISQADTNFVKVGVQTFEAQPGEEDLGFGIQPSDQSFDGFVDPASAIRRQFFDGLVKRGGA